MQTVTCPHCHASWVPRVDNPVMCPRCHRLLNPKAEAPKRAAHDKVKYALRTGQMTKPVACEQCGDVDTKLHAHHPDTADKLRVRWLCPSCHKAQHPVRLLHSRIPFDQYEAYLRGELVK